jgi:hypothetical protein
MFARILGVTVGAGLAYTLTAATAPHSWIVQLSHGWVVQLLQHHA